MPTVTLSRSLVSSFACSLSNRPLIGSTVTQTIGLKIDSTLWYFIRLHIEPDFSGSPDFCIHPRVTQLESVSLLTWRWCWLCQLSRVKSQGMVETHWLAHEIYIPAAIGLVSHSLSLSRIQVLVHEWQDGIGTTSIQHRGKIFVSVHHSIWLLTLISPYLSSDHYARSNPSRKLGWARWPSRPSKLSRCTSM